MNLLRNSHRCRAAQRAAAVQATLAALPDLTDAEVGVMLGIERASVRRYRLGLHKPGPQEVPSWAKQWQHAAAALAAGDRPRAAELFAEFAQELRSGEASA